MKSMEALEISINESREQKRLEWLNMIDKKQSEIESSLKETL